MRTPPILRMMLFCLLPFGSAGPAAAGAGEVSLEAPIYSVERLLRGPRADEIQPVVMTLTTEALVSLTERCSPDLPQQKRATLGRAIVIALRFVPELGIDPYWRSQSVGRYITTVYLQNLFEHHEDLETVRCVDGEQVASYRRDDVF